MSQTQNPFDCIAAKREAQAAIYEEIKDLSTQKQIAYFRTRAVSGPLGRWWQQFQAETKPARHATANE